MINFRPELWHRLFLTTLMVDHYPLFEFAAACKSLCYVALACTEASAPVVLYFRGTTFSRFSRIDSKH